MATKRFEPTVQLDSGLVIPAGAALGKVLTSDAGGAATWQPGGVSYAAALGDGATLSFTITHNLGTRDLVALVREASGSYRQVFPTIAFPTTNTCTVTFGAGNAPATNGVELVLLGGGAPSTTAAALSLSAGAAVGSKLVSDGAGVGSWLKASAVKVAGAAVSMPHNSSYALGKVTLPTPTISLDTDSAWSTVNSRHTPTVAGYYAITVALAMTTATGVAVSFVDLAVACNGAYAFVGRVGYSGGAWGAQFTVSDLYYANGTTDYFEVWANSHDSANSATFNYLAYRVA